jgi:hypothetical protein
MTLQEFNTLPLSRKADILYEWGFFISNEKCTDVNKILYAINGYFAEEHISVITNQVIDIKAFTVKELSRKQLEIIRTKRSFLLLAHGIIPTGEGGVTAAA